ncbi:MAG: hypothetical protein N2572_08690 [Syntrophales bacterium]|nr:hypothetical protein [Syntrophales bacterium]
MNIGEFFTKQNLKFTFLDPFNHFEKKETALEVRKDLITGTVSRILPFRFRGYERPPIEDYLKKSPPDKCPFCLPQRDQLTPRFTEEINPEGQFKRGEVVLFPNAFPHSHHNTVAVMGNAHFIPLEEINPWLLKDGIIVCLEYMKKMKKMDSALNYASINWNYLPPAGGGLLHPHLQTVVGEEPTRFMETLILGARTFRERTRRDMWSDYVAWEKERGERFAGEGKKTLWFSAFAPRGMAGELIFILPDTFSLLSLTEEDILSVSEDLSLVFRYLSRINLISFNLALYGTLLEEALFPVQGRIVPRYLIRPLDTSDVNYFEKLHGEVICPFIPEDMASGLKDFFHAS